MSVPEFKPSKRFNVKENEVAVSKYVGENVNVLSALLKAM